MFLCLAFAGASPAYADCANPTGVYGQTNFNEDYNMLQYCDDTNWIPMYLNDYWANAVSFEGSTPDRLTSGSLTGVTNGKKLTGSFWFRRHAGYTNPDNVFALNGTGSLRIVFDTGNGLLISAENQSGTPRLVVETTGSLSDTSWHHAMFSFDLSDTGKRHFYIDGVDRLSVITYVDDTLQLTGWVEFSTTSGSNVMDADLADFWMDFGTYLDLSDAAERAKFIDGRGKPVHLGDNGERPTGSPPDIFLSGDTASWHTNKGTGGGFTENGALTDAATSPSDHQEPDLTTGLVGHWKLNDATGSTTALDSAGSNDGTLTNMDPNTDWVNGVYGGALEFASSAENLDMAYTPGSTGTIALWMNSDVLMNSSSVEVDILKADGGGARNTVFKKDWAKGGAGTGQCDGDNGSIDFVISPSGGNYSVACTATTVWEAGRWYHLAATWNGTTQQLYVDGVLEDSRSQTESGGWGTLLRGSRLFDGKLDDIRAYNRVLSADEIMKLANGCNSPNAPAGTMIYNDDAHVMQFCDGRDWLAMGPAGDGDAGSGCTNPTGVEREIIYNIDWNTMQYCEGDEWIAIGKRCKTDPHCGGRPDEKIVYIAGGGTGGDYGGITGADSTCQSRATQYGLGGTYKAWLADSDPNSAPAFRFQKSTVPYRMVDGTKIADDWADLTDGTLDHAIDLYASGDVPGLNAVSTNVNADGTQTGSTANDSCNNWTTTSSTSFRFGHKAKTTSGQWTNYGSLGCSSGHLKYYCFEQ